MKFITSKDIKDWSGERESQALLPQLLRKLIFATSNSIDSIYFPVGNNINLVGFDGILKNLSQHTYIPLGESVWEFGVEKNYFNKAEDDFTKRSNQNHTNKSNITFVFVTLQIWGDKSKTKSKKQWIKEKKQLNIWKNVNVIDAIDLETWIEQTPSVGAWLAKRTNNFFDNIIAADDYWENWSKGGRLPLTPELVVNNRKKDAEKISEFISSDNTKFFIQAQTIDEAIGFVLASAFQLNDDFKARFYSKAIYVDSKNALNNVLHNKNKLFIITNIIDNVAFNNAATNGHKVFICQNIENKTLEPNITLSRLNKELLLQSLVHQGVNKSEAETIVIDSGRNLTVLRRILDFPTNNPVWAQPNFVREIIPAILIGQWEDNLIGDKLVIEKLCGTTYDDYLQILIKWKNSEDAPFINVNSKWSVVSSFDKWSLVSAFLTKTDIEKYQEIVLEVLKSKDPILELEPENRMMASLFIANKEIDVKYSDTLKKSLAKSLVLLAVYGDTFKITDKRNSQIWVDQIVNNILNGMDGTMWQSQRNILDILAEASPEEFLNAIENSLNGDKSIKELFQKIPSIIHTSSYHYNLLWALESIAWDKNYLHRVTFILCSLSELKYESNEQNKPFNSLIGIFKTWMPQTNASIQERKIVLESLIIKKKEFAWNLLYSILPERHAIGFPSHKTIWRYSKIEEVMPYHVDIFSMNSFVLNKLIFLAKNDSFKVSRLVDKLDNFTTTNDIDSLINHLNKNFEKFKDKKIIWVELTKLITQHRSYPGNDWNFPDFYLLKLKKVAKKFRPTDLIDLYKHLIGENHANWYELGLPYSKENDYDFLRQELENKQIILLKKIIKNKGLEYIVERINEFNMPYIVGERLACIINKKTDIIFIIKLAKSADENIAVFARSFIFKISCLNGFTWVNEYVYEFDRDSKNKQNLLLNVALSKEVWDLVKKQGEKFEKQYWLKLSHPNFYHLSLDEKVYGVTQLLVANRTISAFKSIDIIYKTIPTELLINVLVKLATTNPTEPIQIDSYRIETIFDELDKREDAIEEDLLNLEVIYMTFLSSYGSHRKPKILHKKLALEPELFAQVIAWIYLSNDENINKQELDTLGGEQLRNRGEAGYKLLDSWLTPPGLDKNGNLKAKIAINWFEKVKTILSNEKTRQERAFYEFGEVLSCYKRFDSTWPDKELCKIIDHYNNKDLNQGFKLGVYNNKGQSSVRIGGDLSMELSLTKRCLEISNNISVEYPTTSSCFKQMSESYSNTIKWHSDRDREDDLE